MEKQKGKRRYEEIQDEGELEIEQELTTGELRV